MTARGVGGDIGGNLSIRRIKSSNGTVTSGKSNVSLAGSSAFTNLENYSQALSTTNKGFEYIFTRAGRAGAVGSFPAYGQSGFQRSNSNTAGAGINAVQTAAVSRSLSSGGGGTGASAGGGSSYGYGGSGSHGSPFSGGAGGGGGTCADAIGNDADGLAAAGGHATPYGLRGGKAGYNSDYLDQIAGSGAGNPGGAKTLADSRAGVEGTGGTLIIFVKGNISVGASGRLVSNGSDGGGAVCDKNSCGANKYWSAAGGGGSGGGNILVLYAGDNIGSYALDESIQVNGGAGGVGSGRHLNATGGKGGAGSYFVEKIDK